jgi:hypothetical protein
MRFDHLQVDFSAGELSPLLQARVDLDKFKTGVKELENMYTTPHGPLVKRGGTRFIARTKYQDKEARLIPFTVGATENFVLEFGDLYIRVFADQGQLITATELITNEDMELASDWYDVGTPTASGRSSDQAHGGTYSWMFTVDDAGEGVKCTDYSTTGVLGYTGGIWVFSSQDKVDIAIRKGDNSGWISETTYNIIPNTWTYIPIEYNETAAGGLGRIEVRSPAGYTTGTWYIDDASLKAIYEITTTYTEAELWDIGFTQSTDVLYLAHKDHAPAKLVRTAIYTWVLSSISFTATPGDWGANDYPQKVAIFEQRLIWANSPSYPQKLWASKSGDYENMTTGSGDADAYVYRIASDRYNAIMWMIAEKVLAIGTAGSEFKLSSNSIGDAVTPTNVSVKRQTNYGSANIRAVQVGGDVLFIQKGYKKLRNFKYKFESDRYVAEDVTILSEHIFGGVGITIVDSTYINEPHSVFYAVRSDGVLVGMTYESDMSIVGWYRFLLGGTDTAVKSIAGVDSATNPSVDDVYLIVNRTVNSSTVRYVEVLQPALEKDDDQENGFYVDCGLSYDESSPATIFQNLNHLEGETVRFLVDGATIADEVVTDGHVTIDRAGQVVHAGLPYNAKMRTLNLEGGNPIGTALGKIKRVSKVKVRLYRSLGLDVGLDDTYDTITFGPGLMGQPPELFTGDKEIPFRNGFDTYGEIEFSHTQALPLTIVAIMPEVRTS